MGHHQFWPPPLGLTLSAGWSMGSSSINAANRVHAQIIRAPKTGNIRSVYFRASIGSNGDITIGVYQVDATTGNPSDTPTPWATNTFVTKSMATGDDGRLINSGNFTADAAVTIGDLIAVCYIAPASSFPNVLISNQGDNQIGFPYTTLFATSWTKSISGPHVALVYDDGSIEIPVGCFGAFGDNVQANVPSSITISSSTTPDMFALRLQVPDFFEAHGAMFMWDQDANFNMRLVTADWDGASSGLLATGVGDSDVRAGTSANPQIAPFDAKPILVPRRWYRCVMEPTATTASSAQFIPLLNETLLSKMPGDIYAHLSTAKDANDDGDWTNYNNTTDGFRVPLIHLTGRFVPHPSRFVMGGLAR